MTEFLDAANAAGLNGKDGKQAIKTKYRGQVSVKDNAEFSGSVDLDEHFKATEPNDNRWDYGVGFNVGHEFALWIEPHPASSSGEIAVMIKKLEWLKAKLQTPDFQGLADLTRAAKEKGEIPFRWLYTGRMSFRRGSKQDKQLAQKGLKFPQRSIQVG